MEKQVSQKRTSLAKLVAISLAISLFAAGNAYAHNIGASCNPDTSVGHAARIASFTGTVTVVDGKNQSISVGNGVIVPAGALIKSGANGRVELAVEDGTDSRASRMTLQRETSLTVNGGLYCDDLRPKQDDGRWRVRELGFKLVGGLARLELAEAAPHRIDVKIETQNALAELQRNRQEPVAVEVKAEGLDDRSRVHVMDHPEIRKQMAGMLFGRSMEDLSAADRQRMQQHAVITAIAAGYYELDEQMLASHPQAQPMIAAMGGGKPLSEMDEGQRGMVAQAIGALLVNSGKLDPAKVYVYDQPDERTVITVESGRFQVRNTHIGFVRDKMLTTEPGKTVYVNGYKEPTMQ